jgi:hypothetical protein
MSLRHRFASPFVVLKVVCSQPHLRVVQVRVLVRDEQVAFALLRTFREEFGVPPLARRQGNLLRAACDGKGEQYRAGKRLFKASRFCCRQALPRKPFPGRHPAYPLAKPLKAPHAIESIRQKKAVG